MEPNSVDDGPFSMGRRAAEMIDGCGLLVKIVVDGTEGGGKYESSDIGTRFTDGVEETDLEGASEDIEADSDSV